MYQLLVNGRKVGQYSPNSSPGKTAEKMARQIYEDANMQGTRTFEFEFVKNRVIADGGDKIYRFRARVQPLPRTRANFVPLGDGGFYKKYNIDVENLLRS